MSWFLTREQRFQLKTLDRLNEALLMTHEHIKELTMMWNAGPQLQAALDRADKLTDAIAEGVCAISEPHNTENTTHDDN